MNPELLFHLRSLSRIIYYVTNEEDRFLAQLRKTLDKYAPKIHVYNQAFGLVQIDALMRDWATRSHTVDTQGGTQDVHNALIKVYTDDPKDGHCFYVFTDPEVYLQDPMVVRRVLNIMHQLHHDIRNIKILIFVGTRPCTPTALEPYMEVVHDQGLAPEEISGLVADACLPLKVQPPKDAPRMFRGLTSYEVHAAISQCIVRVRKEDTGGRRIDPSYIADFRRRAIKKTSLVQYIDTSKFSFDDVGGCQRFKDWCYETRYAWSEEGQAFGLKIPKGVLCVGVWGCGKSLSVKAMAHAWGLPLIQFEMGRLRSSGVGDSERNVYRALRIIEAAAPCVVWVDEAEKSLSGGASSNVSDAGTTSRTIGILSTWLQEMEAPVCLAMTANTLGTLPVEFVNRMNERFFFDLPDEDARLEILKIHLRKARQNPELFQLNELAADAQQMVGREIEQSIEAAMRRSFVEHKPALDSGILKDELVRKPRIFKTLVDQVRELTDWVGWDPDVKDGIKARYAATPNRDRDKTGPTGVKFAE